MALASPLEAAFARAAELASAGAAPPCNTRQHPRVQITLHVGLALSGIQTAPLNSMATLLESSFRGWGSRPMARTQYIHSQCADLAPARATTSAPGNRCFFTGGGVWNQSGRAVAKAWALPLCHHSATIERFGAVGVRVAGFQLKTGQEPACGCGRSARHRRSGWEMLTYAVCSSLRTPGVGS